MVRRVALLELLHPDGIARRSLVIGGNCPAMLLPTPHSEGDEPGDLIILAPTRPECRTRGWLEAAVQSLAERLATDGVVYVLAPRHCRRRIVGLLRRHGLRIDLAMVHVPDWAANRYLVPLQAPLVRYAVSVLIPSRRWKRRLTLLGIRLPGATKLVRTALPWVGFVARRPQARPIFDWPFKLCGEGIGPGNVLISTSWRGLDGATLLHCFAGSAAHPSLIAKTTLTIPGSGDFAREATAITRLGPSAREAGVHVPRTLKLAQIDCHPVLFQTVAPGQRAAALVAEQPRRLDEIVERIADWLERWNRATMTIRPLSCEQLHEALVEPATLLAPLLEQGSAYRDWVAMRCARAVGTPVPLVASHNDLTLHNVLLDAHGQLAVVDWDTSREEDLPLVDLVYAVTDAVVAAGAHTDRLEAFEACFAPGGAYALVTTRLQSRLMEAIGILPELQDICLHACWLRHAINEVRASAAGDPRPFLKIVQWLAWHPSFLEGSQLPAVSV